MNPALDYQLERFRQMTPADRWRAARALYWSARRLKAAQVRKEHPEWPEERVLLEVKKAFTRVRD